MYTNTSATIHEQYGSEVLSKGIIPQHMFEAISDDIAQRYPTIHMYTNAKKTYHSKSFEAFKHLFRTDVHMNSQEKIEQVVNVLFGDQAFYHEQFVFRNRYEKNPMTSKPATQLFIVPQQKELLFKQEFRNNIIVERGYTLTANIRSLGNKLGENTLLITSDIDGLLQSNKLALFDVIVLLDTSISVNMVTKLLSQMMLVNNKQAIHYVDLSLSRANTLAADLGIKEV